MAIAPVRHESLTQDYNFASTSFISQTTNDVINAASETFDDMANQAKGILDQLNGMKTSLMDEANDLIQDAKSSLSSAMGVKGKVSDLTKEAKGLLNQATRITESIYGTLTDLTKLPESLIGSLVDDLFPDNMLGIANGLKSMSKVCRNQALSAGLGFGNFANPNCDGLSINTGNCPPNSAAKLIDPAGISSLNSLIEQGKNLLGKILSLANLGFNAGLCGVFAAVTQGVTSLPILTTAAAIAVNQQAIKGNISAVFDVSKTAVAKGLNIAAAIPATVSNITTGVKNLNMFKNNQKLEAGQRVTASLQTLDPKWNLSDDKKISISKFHDSPLMSEVSNLALSTGNIVKNSLNSVSSFTDEEKTFMSVLANKTNA